MAYTLANAGVLASSIYIPKVAHDTLGMDLFTTGMVVSTSHAALFFSTYAFGRFADRHGARRILQAGLFMSGVAVLLHIFAIDPVTLVSARAMLGVSAGMYPGALVAYASHRRLPMGIFSSFLAFGWALGSILAGATTSLYPGGYTPVFLVGSLLLFGGFGVSLMLPPIREVKHDVPLFPREIIRKNAHVYLPFLVRHLGANCVWVIFPLYITTLGGDMPDIDLWIGIVMFTNAFSQGIIMSSLDRVRRSRILIQGGLMGSVVVFLAFTLVPNVYVLVALQVLLAGSWSCLFVGSLRELVEHNPETATSSGLLSSTIYLGQATGPLLGGLISGTAAHFYGEMSGYLATMYFAAAASASGLLIFRAAVPRRSPGGVG